MDGWTSAAKRWLDRAPMRAGPFADLLEALKREGAPLAGKEDWLLCRLSEQPDLFRVIPARHGPWIRTCRPAPGRAVRLGTAKALDREPWILAAVPLGGAPSPVLPREVCSLLEGIRAWGLGLDADSQEAVARWIQAVREGERAIRRLRTVSIGSS